MASSRAPGISSPYPEPNRMSVRSKPRPALRHQILRSRGRRENLPYERTQVAIMIAFKLPLSQRRLAGSLVAKLSNASMPILACLRRKDGLI